MNEDVRQQAEADYISGMKYKEIAEKYGVTINTVKSWKTRYQWSRGDKKGVHTKKKKVCTQKQKEKGGQPGNRNAVGHGGTGPPGNKNAEKYGFFSKYLPEETREIFSAISEADPLDLLWHQIQIAYAAIIRAQKIAYVRDQQDKTIEKVEDKSGNVYGERWEVQQAWDKQNEFLKAQARAQSELRSLIKQYDEMLHKNWELASEEQKTRIELLKAQKEKTDPEDLPVVPIKYQLSQICVYPDREAANSAVKERLLALRERIINGEKFSTLARIYSQDPGSARRGGELGMASKSIFWPAFADAAMALKPGVVSQIVETPDGFHIIEVLEKKGDMFNARHILLKPEYTSDDREKAFNVLDSLKTEIQDNNIPFELAARFYSEDAATKTNGGQMADPNTGSAYFEIDQLKPQDYNAIKDLKEGEISAPFESKDNEGRGASDPEGGSTVYKIIKVDKIIPAHAASFENDYDLLLSQAEQEKQMEAIDDFIESKIAVTYIVIDPMFKDCPFERDGWYGKFREAE